MTLSTNQFAAFFAEVHGCDPFPWQTRLLRTVAETGEWPSVLDLPTGSGKTAALDIAVFHLALEADRTATRRAPVRIAFVVDRRLVVDDAFTRARKLERALVDARGSVTARVAARLQTLSRDGSPLVARRLRGGIPREDDWARSPSQPTILCSTVDQVGSRLLFRGYGVSDSMKPLHAGLIGADCLLLLDEAHLAEPFRQTLEWVGIYKGPSWRETETAAPWGVALLTATPGETARDTFSLKDEDRRHPVLMRRLEARKLARLVSPAKPKIAAEDGMDAIDGNRGDAEGDLSSRVTTITNEVRAAIAHFKRAENGVPSPAIGVVVNRVARARAVFEQVTDHIDTDEAECVLLIGPARALDRDDVVRQLAAIRTGAERTLERPLVLVSTQCIEAGVDIDLDALITEAAPLDCLRQRFGRLNRAGRDIVPYAVVVAARSDLSARSDDAVYGQAIRAAWESLLKVAEKSGRDSIVEFGPAGFAVPMQADALSPKDDAPILLPAHLDLLTQTSPIPTADPEVALYLHGISRQPDAMTVIWRADIDSERSRDADVRSLLMLVPPRPLEAIELPLWAVRRWLMRAGPEDRGTDPLADIATIAPEEDRRSRRPGRIRKVFRWSGNDERSRWVDPGMLRPGDTIVVPGHYGGVDEFGWNPERETPATDLARAAAEPFAGRRFAVRVAPGLLDNSVADEALADALAGAVSGHWQDLRAALAQLAVPELVRRDLERLDSAKRKRSVTAFLDLYGMDNDRPRGVVFFAPFGIKGEREEEDGRANATEDDATGSVPGYALSLDRHSHDVEMKAEDFARGAGLPAERVLDLKIAGFLHDAGKADRRFQAWLHHGDPLGPDLSDGNAVLAKSGRSLMSATRAAAGLPKSWRHEAFSVRLAPYVARFAEARDAELVLWLIGSHHGHGRPFFPHRDPEDAETRDLPAVLGLPSRVPPGPGPQSLAYDWNGLDWASLFERLKARYGIWELARMEAVVRLADHRASEERAKAGGE